MPHPSVLPQFNLHYVVTPEVAGICVAILMNKPDGASFAVVRTGGAKGQHFDRRTIWLSRESFRYLRDELAKRPKEEKS